MTLPGRAPVCAACGSLNCRLVEPSEIGVSGHLCEVCLSRATAQHAEFKRQFDELIEIGINRELANEVIADRSARFHERRHAKR